MAYKKRLSIAIDLHIHSTASDGSLTPSEIIQLAQHKGLGAISITDHDSIAGNNEALKHFPNKTLKFLTGIEISCKAPDGFGIKGSLHILGYGIDVENSILNENLKILQNARKERNPKIIKKLNQSGFDISLEQVKKDAGTLQLSRPHIAAHMVKRGFVSSIDEAFDRFLGKGKEAYVEKYRIPYKKAIELVSLSGGLAVLAHPHLLHLDTIQKVEQLIITLKSCGLMGIEVIYPQHPRYVIEQLTAIADRNHLLKTGGTDFHGSIKPEIDLGIGTGQLYVPYTFFENIVANLPQYT